MMVFSRCFYFIYFLFILFYFLFLDGFFGIKVSGKLLNLVLWTAFYNTVLQPPSTKDP